MTSPAMRWVCTGCGEHNTEQMADSLRGQLDAENRELAALQTVDALQARVAELDTAYSRNTVLALRYRDALRAMARRAVGYRRNARRAVEREMSYKLPSGETVAQMRRDQTMGAFHKMRTERLQARVEVLTAALTDALEGLEDMRPYVSDYFAEKWGHDGYITRARAALAAAESEAKGDA